MKKRIITLSVKDDKQLQSSSPIVGYAGEHLATQLNFNVPTSWAEDTSMQYYVSYLTQDGKCYRSDTLQWPVSVLIPSAVMVEGDLLIQITAVINDIVAKSAVCRMIVGKSVNGSISDIVDYTGLLESKISDFTAALNTLKTTSVSMPYIGNNGNWFIYDGTKKSYNDSGVSAGGVKSYNDLQNIPSIDGASLKGSLTKSDLYIADSRDLMQLSKIVKGDNLIDNTIAFKPGVRTYSISDSYRYDNLGLVSLTIIKHFAAGTYTISGGDNAFKLYRLITNSAILSTDTNICPYTFTLTDSTESIEFGLGMPNNNTSAPTPWAYDTSSAAGITLKSSNTDMAEINRRLSDIDTANFTGATNIYNAANVRSGCLVNGAGSVQYTGGWSCCPVDVSGKSIIYVKIGGLMTTSGTAIGKAAFVSSAVNDVLTAIDSTSTITPICSYALSSRDKTGDYFVFNVPPTAKTFMINVTGSTTGGKIDTAASVTIYADTVPVKSQLANITGDIDYLAAASQLQDKKICVCGDSISEHNWTTEYLYNYDSAGKPLYTYRSYHDYIAARTGCTVQNIALSNSGFGATNRTAAPIAPMYTRVNQIADDCDIVLVAHGTNDYGASNPYPIGDINDVLQDTTNYDAAGNTVCGFINEFITRYRAEYPSKPIAIMTPLPRYYTNNGDVKDINGVNAAGWSLNDIRDKLILIANKYNIPCLDMRDVPLYPSNAYNRSTYYAGGDGLHPNAAGHKLISRKIQSFLENVMADVPIYKSYALGDVTTSAVNGLAKFTVQGYADNSAYNPVDITHKGVYTPIKHTVGVLKSTDTGTVLSSIQIDMYGANANSTYSLPECRDSLTQTGFIRRFSDDVYISQIASKGTYSSTSIGTNNILHTIVLPGTAFTNLPAKANIINMFCSMCYVRSADYINTSGNNTNASTPWIAMSYDNTSNTYTIYVRTYSSCATFAQLTMSKFYIRYQLQTPIIDNHTNKLIVTPQSVVTYTYTGDTAYAPKSSPEVTLSVPTNTAAAAEAGTQLAINVNDLNTRVDNVEVLSGKIEGVSADGQTDDSVALQAYIDKAIDESTGTINEIILPAGTYALKTSLLLNRPNLTLTGDGGKVILKPQGIYPAIIVSANDCTVKNISIYISRTTTTVQDADDGSHSGILVWQKNGMYRTAITDVTIQGGYGYANMDSERSYGIYFKGKITDGTYAEFAYYSTIKDCEFFSVYCGLFVGRGVQPCTINFDFDCGGNIYGMQNFATECGCGYGAIINGDCCNINFKGQSQGCRENHKTESGDYCIQLTKAAIKCNGSYNYISGVSYDPQRTETFYYFGEKSYCNRYYSPIFNEYYGLNSYFYNQYNSSNQLIYKVANTMVYDEGKANICLNSANTDDQMLSAGQPNSLPSGIIDDYSAANKNLTEAINVTTRKHHGLQDNTIANLNKYSTVKLYSVDLNGNQTEINTDLSAMFTSNADFLSLKMPAEYMIELDLPSWINIDDFGLEFFNGNIPRELTIWFKTQSSATDTQGIYSESAGNYHIATNVTSNIIWKNMREKKNNTETWLVDKIKGARIYINSTPCESVDLGYVFATDRCKSGNAWISTAGGNIYGDINYNGSPLTTKEYVDNAIQTAINTIINGK